MKTRAAVLRKGGEPWELTELDLDEPEAGEVRHPHRLPPPDAGRAVRRGQPAVRHPDDLGLWQSGDVKLTELVTRRYTLDQVNQGYQDMMDGKNIRGVIIHEH
jgi:Zn-dependent alcohol dehydrogenase